MRLELAEELKRALTGLEGSNLRMGQNGNKK